MGRTRYLNSRSGKLELTRLCISRGALSGEEDVLAGQDIKIVPSRDFERKGGIGEK